MTYQVFINGSFAAALSTTNADEVRDFIESNGLEVVASGKALCNDSIFFFDCERG